MMPPLGYQSHGGIHWMTRVELRKNWFLALGLALVFDYSSLSAIAFDWVVTPLGGKDKRSSPYEPGDVDFLDNGFMT